MKQKIEVSLSSRSFNSALHKVRKYKERIIRKTELLEKRVADEIQKSAQQKFSSSVYDDLVNQGGRTPNVAVTVETTGNIHVVVAHGEEAIFVEFGAGVYHNGAAGTSPHPNGAKHGYTIGSYGKNGERKAWGFVGDDGELHITRGTKAQMPLYFAMRDVISKIPQIAREVFSGG